MRTIFYDKKCFCFFNFQPLFFWDSVLIKTRKFFSRFPTNLILNIFTAWTGFVSFPSLGSFSATCSEIWLQHQTTQMHLTQQRYHDIMMNKPITNANWVLVIHQDFQISNDSYLGRIWAKQLRLCRRKVNNLFNLNEWRVLKPKVEFLEK